MKAESFCYWLQGLFELSNPETLDANQVHLIKQHLNMVFLHDIDPKMGDQKKQDLLNAIHNKPAYQPHTPINTGFTGRDEDGNIMRC